MSAPTVTNVTRVREGEAQRTREGAVYINTYRVTVTDQDGSGASSGQSGGLIDSQYVEYAALTADDGTTAIPAYGAAHGLDASATVSSVTATRIGADEHALICEVVVTYSDNQSWA